MITTRGLREPQTIATIVTVAWTLGLLAVTLSGLDRETRSAISQVAIIVTALVSTVLCCLRARRSSGRRARAWLLLGAAGFTGLTGNVLAAFTGAENVSELALLLALVIGVAALRSFPDRELKRPQVLRMLLDGVVVGGSVLFVSALVIFPALTTSNGGWDLTRVITIALPVMDAVLATFAVLLIMRSTGTDRVPLALVGLSFTMYAVADLTYAVVDSSVGFQFGTVADLGWVVGYALGGIAACHPAGAGPAQDAPATDGTEREGSAVAGTVVTFCLFIAAAVVQIQESLGAISGLAVALWFIVIGAVALRQISLVVTNERLRRRLEIRVQERTQELADLTRTTQLTLTSVGEGIYGVDPDGIVTFVNPAGARTLGMRSESLVGRHAHDELHAAREDGTPFPYSGCYIHEAVTQGVTINSEEDFYRRADGALVPVEVTASPVIDDGHVTGAVVVFRDVTQRREIDRMKSEFLSVISHELRTPLTSIKGAIGLVAGGATGEVAPESARLLGIAGGSVDRLTRLINDILEVERLGSGADPLELVDVPLEQVVRAAVDQTEALATQSGIALVVGDVPGTVNADVDRIVQTLVNLLGNAVKFTGTGGRVDVSARPAGMFFEVAVRDTGRGIPADRLESIFGRFEQVDSSDAREKGGTGLGLAISRGIVSRHGGRIWAESEPGVGSTFLFTLRSADAGADTADKPPSSTRVG
ncbi:sensor histidine kinase [Litorihabitans aurantiacus]|uniref:sensor histidine kinase n=1 Tax=Litorihabitans aurantiacus TaxID=1930061 RepID=UPI0024E16489|nr:ATP-binding protein [Litorihabitans aurantiacus]